VFKICCKDGDVVIPAIQHPPPQLRELYESSDEPAKKFRDEIRRYNGKLAFTSIGYTADTRVNGGYVPFQIQGQLYHLQGPLENQPGAAPRYSQLWIVDSEMANDVRCRDRNIDPATLNELTDVLPEVNPYIGLYETARDQMVTTEAHDSLDHTPLTAQLSLVMEAAADRRRENLPTASEVAGVIPDTGLKLCHRWISR
jgi:hypothetical protein